MRSMKPSKPITTKPRRSTQRKPLERVPRASQGVSLADIDRLVGEKLAEKDQKALMRIPAPPAQPWKLSDEEVTLVKNHIAKGATDSELQFCLAVARRFKLDPFRQQIWFVARNDKSAEGGKRWIPITGINGLLHIAARDHKDFGSNDEPEFGPMKNVKWTHYDKHGEIQAPEWARVTLWKKRHEHPIVATVFWDEVYPNVGAAPLVRQMPRLMLGKCALAQAVRRAYPATDGLYISEEFQGPAEYTDGGRQIIRQDAQTLDLPAPAEDERLKGYLAKLTPEQRVIEEAALAKKTPAQREVLATKLATSQEEGLAKRPSAAVTPESPSESAAPKPVLHFLWNAADQTASVERPSFPLPAELKAFLLKRTRDGKVTGEDLDALHYECRTRVIELRRRKEPAQIVENGNRWW